MTETYDGRCLCGSLRFKALGKPKWVLACHCESCRRHSGAPVSVFAAFDNDAVTVIEGQIAKFESSPGTERGFCARCGSTISCATAMFPNEIHLHTGAFERAGELAPSGELFPEERLSWNHPFNK